MSKISRTRPLRDAVSDVAGTISGLATVANKLTTIAVVHLDAYELEAKLESLEDLSELAGWTVEVLQAKKDAVIVSAGL